MNFDPRWGRQIHYGPLVVPLVLGVAAAGITTAVTRASQAKPNLMTSTPTPTPAQTVDNTPTSNLNNAGRAALIMTSPQGVQGTDPTNRYALLGNQTGLGNR